MLQLFSILFGNFVTFNNSWFFRNIVKICGLIRQMALLSLITGHFQSLKLFCIGYKMVTFLAKCIKNYFFLQKLTINAIVDIICVSPITVLSFLRPDGIPYRRRVQNDRMEDQRSCCFSERKKSQALPRRKKRHYRCRKQKKSSSCR